MPALTTRLPRQLRVCFVGPDILPLLGLGGGKSFGGAEVQIRQIARYLVKQGFDVDVLVGDSLPGKVQWHEGLRLIPCIPDSSQMGLGAKLLSKIRLMRCLYRSGADIYVATCAGPEAAYVALYARIAGRKFVYRTAHELDCSGEYERSNGFRGRLFGIGLRAADAVVTQHQVHQRMLQAGGVAAAVIHNSFALEETAEEHDRPIDVLWVGRCEAWKNPGLLLDLADALPHRQFVMICPPKPGFEGLFESLRDRVKTIPNLCFIEHVPFTESDGYFRRSKLLAGTSDAEGFPNTYIQACIAGTPIVSYKVDPGGFLERTGSGLVAGGDFGRFAKDAEDLLRNPVGWRQASKKARSYASETHDIELEGPKWIALLLSVAGASSIKTIGVP